MKINLITAYDRNQNVYRFKINANRFTVNFKTSADNKNIHNIGSTMVNGVLVLYKNPDRNVWANVEASNESPLNINLSQSVHNKEFYEVMIYAPILNRVDELVIECPDEYSIICEDSADRSILVIGGQKTFGIGCTTVGSMYSNIIGRKFNADIRRIAFNSDSYHDKIPEILNDNRTHYDLCIIELEDNFNPSLLQDTLSLLEECSDNIIGWYALNNTKLKIERHDIKIKDISCVFNDELKDMCSFDDDYINDAGNIMIYKSLKPLIKEVTKWNI